MLDLKSRGFPCSGDVINIMLVFLTNTVPFLSYLSNILLFDTLYKKYATGEISTKKEIICDTGSIKTRI